MKKSGVTHSVQGSWQGRYFYSSRADAYAFEAVFVDIDGRVEGNILDDGCLGEATAAGSFGYPKLEFTKIYHKKTASAVKYRGTMSEDGKMLSGTWTTPKLSGSWLAVRKNDSDDLKFEEWQDTFLHDEVEVHQPQTSSAKTRR